MRFIIVPVGLLIRLFSGSTDGTSATPRTASNFPSDGRLGSDQSSGTTNHHMYFCGMCCDFRRAILVVNSISIVWYTLLGIFICLEMDFIVDDMKEDVDDDTFSKDLDNPAFTSMLEAMLLVKVIVGILIGVLGIYGACQFKQWALITAASFYGIFLAVDLFTFEIVFMLFNALMLYPHICMIQLMKADIMTETNYHNIASCCGGGPENLPATPPGESAAFPKGDFA